MIKLFFFINFCTESYPLISQCKNTYCREQQQQKKKNFERDKLFFFHGLNQFLSHLQLAEAKYMHCLSSVIVVNGINFCQVLAFSSVL